MKLVGEEKEANGSSDQSKAQMQFTGLTNQNDFESLVLRKLRQEEERKRLIAQMLAEED